MSEITTNNVNGGRDRSRFVWYAIFALTVLVYFFGLNIPLLGPDEPRYAQVAREMFDRGDWVSPTLGGFNWFEKPALLYWTEILAYKVFGVSEFAARLGPAVFGLGTVVSLWILAKFVAAGGRG
ncbi:MAG: phospholipid carrier-dependent glycosyltransferase, partial [Acidobacteriota bacterium]